MSAAEIRAGILSAINDAGMAMHRVGISTLYDYLDMHLRVLEAEARAEVEALVPDVVSLNEAAERGARDERERIAAAVEALYKRQANGVWCGGYLGREQPQFPGYDPDTWVLVIDRAAVLRIIRGDE